MAKDFYLISVYTEKYKDRPQSLRERLRENKAIVDKRKKQASFMKGKFDMGPQVEF